METGNLNMQTKCLPMTMEKRHKNLINKVKYIIFILWFSFDK